MVYLELTLMAKLPGETKDTILNLLRQLAEVIDEAGSTELAIFEQFGETETSIPILEELQDARERLRNPYNRLCTLFLNIAESQPDASAAVLNLLYQAIEQAQANADAVTATIQESKRDIDLL